VWGRKEAAVVTPAEVRAKAESRPPQEQSQLSSQSVAAVDSIRATVSVNPNWAAFAIALIALLARLLRG
jgi:hypothetical protein